MPILSTVCCIALAAGPAPESLPTASALEESVLRDRRAMKTGRIEIQIRASRLNKTTHELSSFEWDRTTYRLYFDEHSQRADIASVDLNNRNRRRIKCFSGQSHKYIYYETGLPPGTAPLSIQDPAALPPISQRPGDAVIDPRLIGIVPSELLNLAHSRFSELFADSERKNVRVSKATLRGKNCFKLEFDSLYGSSFAYWIDPGKGDSVVRARLTFDPGTDHQATRTVDSEVVLLEGTNVWYPKTYRFVKDDPAVDPDTANVEEAEIRVIALNEPLAPDWFSLATMDIPAGTPVAVVPSLGGDATWDGNSIVVAKPPARRADRSWIWRRLLMVNGVVFAILSGLAIVWGVWRGKSPSR